MIKKLLFITLIYSATTYSMNNHAIVTKQLLQSSESRSRSAAMLSCGPCFAAACTLLQKDAPLEQKALGTALASIPCIFLCYAEGCRYFARRTDFLPYRSSQSQKKLQ